jgi:predicted RNA-binding Zn-ribbon protein involved in translation (DUF1610 family)
MHDNEASCAFCRSTRELLSGRPVVPGYEIRHYPCPKCGEPMQIVMRVERSQAVFVETVPSRGGEPERLGGEPARASR